MSGAPGTGGGGPRTQLGWEKRLASETGFGEAGLGPSLGPQPEAGKGLRPAV